MDIKTDNIGLDSAGKFILIDIGNATTFGTATDVTDNFVPLDFGVIKYGQMLASPDVDFWLLASTFLFKLTESSDKRGRMQFSSILAELENKCVVISPLKAVLNM